MEPVVQVRGLGALGKVFKEENNMDGFSSVEHPLFLILGTSQIPNSVEYLRPLLVGIIALLLQVKNQGK